jgi:hypothetical protein
MNLEFIPDNSNKIKHNYINDDFNCLIYNFKKADNVGLLNYLNSINWFLAFSNAKSTNEMWTTFEQLLMDGFTNYVPMLNLTNKNKLPNCKMTKNIKNLLRKKNAWHYAKHQKSPYAWSRYKSINKSFRSEIKSLQNKKINDICKFRNTKRFFNLSTTKLVITNP